MGTGKLDGYCVTCKRNKPELEQHVVRKGYKEYGFGYGKDFKFVPDSYGIVKKGYGIVR